MTSLLHRGKGREVTPVAILDQRRFSASELFGFSKGGRKQRSIDAIVLPYSYWGLQEAERLESAVSPNNELFRDRNIDKTLSLKY
jgi:hypothetical protein